jgi:hypothetical protein
MVVATVSLARSPLVTSQHEHDVDEAQAGAQA